MAQHIPENRRASISMDLLPYVKQKMAEWDVDFTTAVNTLLLDHKRAGLIITGGGETPLSPPEKTDNATGSFQDETSDVAISNLVSLLDHGVSPMPPAS